VALTQLRSALKNRVHALLAKHGILHGYSHLFGPGGSGFLAARSSSATRPGGGWRACLP